MQVQLSMYVASQAPKAVRSGCCGSGIGVFSSRASHMLLAVWVGAVMTVSTVAAQDEGQASVTPESIAVDADSAEQTVAPTATGDSEQVAAPLQENMPAPLNDFPSNRGADVTPEEAARILLQELDRPVEARLSFNFTAASWRDVLDWMATEGDLSLQIDRYPEGSISFIDRARTYTVSESLDLLNRLLLDRGYALVRRGRMLFLVDLEVQNADKLISELADLVPMNELESRGKSDIVTSIFPLGSMTPDEAKTQLPQMVGPWGRVIVLESARQAKVTERAEKLVAIREVIKQSDQEVHEIKLLHRSAEELLQTARPLLGLEPDVNSSDDIRIAVGLYGDRIYVTGLQSKVSILENLVAKADQPLEGSSDDANAEVARPIFQTHVVRTADVSTVFEVLQTLLQDEPGTRIAIESTTKSIIAFATPAVHKQIDEVIEKMEGSGEDFEVFQLKRIDPAQALLTINKYFGVTEEGGTGPIVDGDPSTGKMWVRGSQDEIAQIKRLLEQLDGSGSEGLLSGKVRLLPLNGRQAEEALRQLQLYWRMTGRENSIRVLAPDGSIDNNGIRERKIQRVPSGSSQPPTQSSQPASDLDAARFDASRFYYLTQAPAGQEGSDSVADRSAINASGESEPLSASNLNRAAGADILIELTPNGIRIASDDTEALDELEELLSQLIGPVGMQNELPTIYWLKYIKADIAAELIAAILGGSSSSGSLTDTITSGLGGGMLGGLMGLAGGGGSEESSAKSILTSTGSVNIVADLRLNALFIQANEIDLQVIEMVLEKVDREESPEDIELTSAPRMIPVLYQSATEIAKVVKELYADRMGSGDSGGRGSSGGGGGGGGPGGGGGGGQPSPQDFLNALRGGRGGRGSEPAKSERTKITIAVDAQSNSLLVSATTQDFEQIRLLVNALDQGGRVNEDSTIVYNVPGTLNGTTIIQALEAMVGVKVEAKDSGSSTSTSSARPSDSGSNNTDAANAFRDAMRARFGGGSSFGGGSPFGGGRPGGFGGGGGPGGGGGRDGGGRGGR